MNTPLLQDRLGKATTGARKALDRLTAAVPPTAETLRFDEYMARASLQARHDPEFRRNFARSLMQYQTVRGGLDNGLAKRE